MRRTFKACIVVQLAFILACVNIGIGRAGIDPPIYRRDALPNTEAAGHDLIKLPNFPSANRDLLDQYVHAFEKVILHAEQITEACSG